MTPKIQKIVDEFIEKGADIEHDRWAGWQKWMFSKSFFPEIASEVESVSLEETKNDNSEDMSKEFEEGVKVGWNSLRDKLSGCVIIPKEYADRWFRQINTKYADLSEQEKESDRKETRNYVPFLLSFLNQTRQETLEETGREVEKLKKYHKEFECKDLYEAFCEDQNCENAPKEYNQAVSDIINLIQSKKENI